jgi:hippurate hydrolase
MALRNISFAIAAVFSSWSGLAHAEVLDAVGAKAAVDTILNRNYPELFALYADIHAHPELGFRETRTASLLAARMRMLGFTVTEHVGVTGVVAVLRNGPGPTVLVRTELDALPIEEKTGLPYASTVRTTYDGQPSFVAHMCGHDIHMAVWVGTAQALTALKDKWHGTLLFIAQPAEEIVGGAAAMLKDGLFERFPRPDYGLALHTGPFAYGHVLYRAGILSSNVDQVEITFNGRGGHGSRPDEAIDPVLIAARFVVDVQAVISREKNPAAPGVVSIGAIHGGTAGNIIPDAVTVRGTIRNYDQDVRAKLIAGVERVALSEAAMAGAANPHIRIYGGTGSIVNDPDLTARTANVFGRVFGSAAEQKPDLISASDDYSEFVQAGMPHSLFFEIGIYDPQKVEAAKVSGVPLPFNHSPNYAPVPEPTIRTGVEAMSLALLNILGN